MDAGDGLTMADARKFRPLDLLRKIWSDDSGLTSPARATLTALVMRADDRGECWPSLSRIARDAGLGRSTAAEALTALTRAGWVRRTPRPLPSTTLYTVQELDSPGAGRSRTRTEIVQELDGDSPGAGHKLPTNYPTELPKGVADATAGTKVSARTEKTTTTTTWLTPYLSAWTDTMGGTAPAGRLARSLRPLDSEHDPDTVAAVWRRYLADHRDRDRAQYATAEDFAARYGVYADRYSSPQSRPRPAGAYQDPAADIDWDEVTMP